MEGRQNIIPSRLFDVVRVPPKTFGRVCADPCLKYKKGRHSSTWNVQGLGHVLEILDVFFDFGYTQKSLSYEPDFIVNEDGLPDTVTCSSIQSERVLEKQRRA